jgi:hypothetical protein
VGVAGAIDPPEHFLFIGECDFRHEERQGEESYDFGRLHGDIPGLGHTAYAINRAPGNNAVRPPNIILFLGWLVR